MTQQIFKMTVIEVCPLAEEIIQLWVKSDDDFSYSAGQYVMLGLEEDDLKPFSIANAPQENGLLEFHIRRMPDNDWMDALFDVKAFDTLYVDGPKDQYQLDEATLNSSNSILLVAGGTGFAPMKALLDSLLVLNTNKIIEFYWGARQASDLYAHDTLLKLCQTHHQLNYIPVVSDGDFSGRQGVVHQAVLSDHPDLSAARVYLCGPWPMQEAAKADFLAAGLPQDCFN